MCSVAMNFSKFASCFMVRTCVRWTIWSAEHDTSEATTYSLASTSGGAQGRITAGGIGWGMELAAGGETAGGALGTGAAATTATGLSSATSAALASFAAASLGKS